MMFRGTSTRLSILKEIFMNRFMSLALAAVAAAGFAVTAPEAVAQPDVDIGVQPDCPYGYYDYAPYSCAPYGYYGPAWFIGGVFIGAGPWFHGPAYFHGHVDNRFDVRHGYNGPAPSRGDRPERAMRLDRMDGFRGNEMRDGMGHEADGMGHEGLAMGREGGGRR
jgi:hypothetical protein